MTTLKTIEGNCGIAVAEYAAITKRMEDAVRKNRKYLNKLNKILSVYTGTPKQEDQIYENILYGCISFMYGDPYKGEKGENTLILSDIHTTLKKLWKE